MSQYPYNASTFRRTTLASGDRWWDSRRVGAVVWADEVLLPLNQGAALIDSSNNDKGRFWISEIC
jgi:hypothetical protein